MITRLGEMKKLVYASTSKGFDPKELRFIKASRAS